MYFEITINSTHGTINLPYFCALAAAGKQSPKSVDFVVWFTHQDCVRHLVKHATIVRRPDILSVCRAKQRQLDSKQRKLGSRVVNVLWESEVSDDDLLAFALE